MRDGTDEHFPAAAVAAGIAVAGAGADSWAVSCSVDRDSIAPDHRRQPATPLPRLSCSSGGAAAAPRPPSSSRGSSPRGTAWVAIE